MARSALSVGNRCETAFLGIDFGHHAVSVVHTDDLCSGIRGNAQKAERKHRQLEEEYRRTREEEVFREKINTVSQIVGLPKKDQTFLSEFDGIVRENLSNPLLSNEIIADKMAVSPSTLVRRIRRLLETSPNNYVRNLRLAVAAEMLRDPQGNNILKSATQSDFPTSHILRNASVRCSERHLLLMPNKSAEVRHLLPDLRTKKKIEY